MTNAAKHVNSQTVDLPADVQELAHAIARLPVEHRQHVEPVLARVLESTLRRRRILALVQDARP